MNRDESNNNYNEINSDSFCNEQDALIVFYGKMFSGSLDLDRFQTPGVRFSEDQNLLPVADAVVMHIPQVTHRNKPTLRKTPGQLWVSWSLESEINYPGINDQAYDLKMTYQRDADVWIPYFRNYGSKLLEEIVLPLPPKGPDCIIASFISSTVNRSHRLEYLIELSKHINIHHYGRFMRNRTIESDKGGKTKLETLRHYKFAIAFENSITPDYVTEKYYDPLLAGTIPIYLGAPNITDYAPGHDCHINVNDFSDPAELACYLKKLDQNDSLIDRHLKWKTEPLCKAFVNEIQSSIKLPHSFIQLAELVKQRIKRMDNIVPHKIKSWELITSKDMSSLTLKKSRASITLNGASYLIWELCDGQRNVSHIQETLLAAYPDAKNQIKQDVLRTLRLLHHKGIIELI